MSWGDGFASGTDATERYASAVLAAAAHVDDVEPFLKSDIQADIMEDMAGTIIERARRGSGLSQRELARRSGTSQPTLSTYEHGTKSPTLAVAERIVNSSGFDLDLVPRVAFTTHTGARGEPFVVPDRLWRLDTAAAFATVTLPQHLHWSGPSRPYNLRDRRDRARVYEIVLREGEPVDLLTYIDGALLVDLWEDLVIPAGIRSEWTPLITSFGAIG